MPSSQQMSLREPRRVSITWSRLTAGAILGVVGALAASVMSSTIALGAAGSASQYQQEAIAAAQAANSLRVTATVKETLLQTHKTYVIDSVIDMTQTESTTVVTEGKSHGTILVVPNLAYAKGTASFLEDIIGLSKAEASKYAEQWISISSSYKYYLSLVYAHIVSQLGSVATATGALKLSGPTKVDDKRVVEVSGGLSTPLSLEFGKNGTQSLYVSTSSPFLPVSFVFSAVTKYSASETVREIETDTLSRWGEPVSVTPPASSVPIATVTGP